MSSGKRWQGETSVLFNVLHAVFGGSLQSFCCASNPCTGIGKSEFRCCGIVGDWSNFECIHPLFETGLAMWSRLAHHPQSSCHSFPPECWNYRALSPGSFFHFNLLKYKLRWSKKQGLFPSHKYIPERIQQKKIICTIRYIKVQFVCVCIRARA